MGLNENSFFGDLGQKFEAICLEVKSVGDRIKKFCSDTMDELLPLSSDYLMQQENPEWNLVYNFYMANICEKPVIRNQFKSRCSKLNDSGSCNLSKSPSREPTCFDGKVEEKFHLSEITVLVEAPIGNAATISSPALLSETEERRDTVECIAGLLGIDNGIPEKSEVESNADVKEEHQAEVSEQVGNIRLDESSVLVDSAEYISTADLQGKPRSYKEKIQDVFKLRKRSSSKGSTSLIQEQKPCHQNKKLSNQESGKIMHSPSPIDSLLESGWELL